MRTYFFAFTGLAFLASTVAAQPADLSAPLPPTLPWHGASDTLVAAPNDPWITPIEATGFDRTPSYAETRAWLERLVAGLPEVPRTVVTLYYYQDRSVAEVATILRMPENTVKTHLSRARAALRVGWTAENVPDPPQAAPGDDEETR